MTQTTRERAIEAAARALLVAQGCSETENEIARASDEATAAFDAILEVLGEPSLDMVYIGSEDTARFVPDGLPFTATRSCFTAMLAAVRAGK
jgi:hypothetical protein